MNKLLIICGPTATGKTALAIKLAQKFNGEIISADSRQVYKGMDIGTGKDLTVNSEFNIQNTELRIKNQKYSVGYYDIQGIPVWLYDIITPDERFSVADYYDLAWIVIKEIWRRGKLPILVGGTGFYIKAVIDGIGTLGIPPNEKLRQELEKKDLPQLQNELKKINLEKYERMNDSDRNNRRRLVRAIEITLHDKNENIKNNNDNEKIKNDLNILFIGLTADKKVIDQKINKRVEKRIDQGITKEIQALLDKGYSWDLPAMSGLGYKQWKEYIKGILNEEETIEIWKSAELNFAKRQLTWFKKEKRIRWFNIEENDYPDKIVADITSWLL